MCLRIPIRQQHSYLSTPAIIAGLPANIPPQYFWETKVTKDASVDQFKTFLNSRKQVTILVFMEKNEQKQVPIIEEICEQLRIYVELLLNEDLVKNDIETTATELDKVLFLIDAEIGGRGVDFKLLVNAEVLILLNGDLNFTWSDVAQMAGRGNRSQGTPSAHI